jgi:hypothetical protein
MPAEEHTQLFAWLSSQPNITSLSFPNLVERTSREVNVRVSLPAEAFDAMDFPSTLTATDEIPPPLPPKDHLPRVVTSLSLFSNTNTTTNNALPSTLLPALTSLHAPPTLVTLLVPTRPLKHVTIHIHTNLDTGLRPSALVAAVLGIVHLSLRFSDGVDRRSVEKVMRAAAVALGGGCEHLDVEIGMMVTDEVGLTFRI